MSNVVVSYVTRREVLGSFLWVSLLKLGDMSTSARTKKKHAKLLTRT